MAKPVVLITDKFSGYLMDALTRRYAIHSVAGAKGRFSVLEQVGAEARAIVTRATIGVTQNLVDACPNLEIIVSRGAGSDRLEASHAASRGIIVATSPGPFSSDVADLGVGLLLAVARNIVVNHQFVTAGHWAAGRQKLARSIKGWRIGIVGLGSIGSLVARRMLAFDCEVAYCAQAEKPDAPYRFYPDAVSLARDSDALVVCAPGGPATRNLVDRQVLDALGPAGILINIGRGSIVDEDALVQALRDGRLGGAGLDVFADEPNVPAALFDMPNVVLQPHQGAWTAETQREIDDSLLSHLDDHFHAKGI